MGHEKLKIWQMAGDIETRTHRIVNIYVRQREQYTVGSQLRRSISSVRSNIEEGFGRRYYQQEYLRFLTFARASIKESTGHLRTIQKGVPDKLVEITAVLEDCIILGKMTTNLIKTISRGLKDPDRFNGRLY